MLKKFLFFYFLININFTQSSISHNNITTRKNLILALGQDLFIKNIILLKHPLFIIDDKIISFVKNLSQFNISFSCESLEKIKLKIHPHTKLHFSKTLILTLKEKFNNKIYELISEDEKAASKFLWLVWKNENGALPENGTYYIPYNTQLLIVNNGVERNKNISEIYHPQIFSRVLFERHFGIWSENKGIEIPQRDLFIRRLDMNRTKLYTLFDKVKGDLMWVELWKFILDEMNFRPDVTFVNEMLQKAELEDRYPPFELRIRNELYDHTLPNYAEILGLMWKQSGNIYIRYDGILEDRTISTYVRPFSKRLWFAIVISILLVATCTSVVALKTDFSILSACFHPLEAFANQDGSEAPNSVSIRITILTGRFVAMFIVPSYSAFLLTYILYPNIKLPFTDMKGLVQDGTYRLGYSQVSNFDYWFQATTDHWSKTAHKKLRLNRNEMPVNTTDYLNKLCRYKKVAFMAMDNLIPFAPCKIIKIPTSIMTGWFGVRLRHKSPYKKSFNRLLKIFLSTGLIDRKDKAHLNSELRNQNRNLLKEEDESVKIENIAPVLQILIFLYILAFMMFFLECLYKKLQG